MFPDIIISLFEITLCNLENRTDYSLIKEKISDVELILHIQRNINCQTIFLSHYQVHEICFSYSYYN